MNKKKMVAVAIVLALLLLIGGMLAYFTDTDTATNVFTIGNVDISLSEPLWDALADENDNDIPDVAENITPGKTIAKDPTVTNDSTTNPAYVFVEVKVPALDASTPLFTYTTNEGWTEVGTASYASNVITHVYAYGTASAMTSLAAQATTSSAVFSSVTFGDFTADDDLSGFADRTEIVVNAYGIQTTDLGVTAPADIFGLFTSNS